MSGFFSKSKALAENTRIEFCSILLNLDEFRPFPKKESRNVFGVQSEKFVIFFGSELSTFLCHEHYTLGVKALSKR